MLEIKAIRGAISVDEDRPELVIEAAKLLTETILRENELPVDRIVSAIYTATPDLTSAFPAVGAREAGLSETALLCAQEIAVPSGLPRCIRVLMHAQLPPGRAAKPVYLRDAVQLRPDLVDQPKPDVADQRRPDLADQTNGGQADD